MPDLSPHPHPHQPHHPHSPLPTIPGHGASGAYPSAFYPQGPGPGAGGGGAQSRSIADDLGLYTRVLKRSLPFIGIGIVFCVTIAVIYLAKLQTSYNATISLLIIQQGGNSNSKGEDDIFDFRGSTDYISTQALILRSDDVIRKAVAKLPEDKKPPWLNTTNIVDAVNSRFDVSITRDEAKVLTLNLKSDTRETAQKLLDEIIESYNVYLQETYLEKNNNIVTMITRGVQEAEAAIKSAREKFNAKTKDNPIFTVDENQRSFFIRNLDQIDQKANHAKMKAEQLKLKLETAKKMAGEGRGHAEIQKALDLIGTQTVDPRDFPDSMVGLIPGMGRGEARRSDVIDMEPSDSFEKVSAQVSDARRLMASERMGLAHLREQRLLMRQNPEFQRKIESRFNSRSDISQLRLRWEQAQANADATRKTARSKSDPSVLQAQESADRIKRLLNSAMESQRDVVLAAVEQEGAGGVISKRILEAEAKIAVLSVKEKEFVQQLEALRPGYLARQRQELAKLLDQVGPEDPKVKQLRRQIATANSESGLDLKSTLDSKTWELIETYEKAIQTAEHESARFTEVFNKELAAHQGQEQARNEALDLHRDVERSEEQYRVLMGTLSQAKLIQFTSIKASRLSEIHTSEARPPYVLILTMAIVVGVGLGIGGGFLQEMLDTRIHSLEELKAILNMNVLGMIPMLPKYQLKLNKRVAMITHDKPRSILAESYKSLRTHYEFLRRNQKHQVVLVTSAMSGDGKTTSSSNLAISLAKAGIKTLLVDADLRRPNLTILFNVPRTNGLSQILEGKLAIEQAVRETEVENLHFLNAGEEVSNPSELLLSNKLREFIDEVREKYEVVIIDSSPILAITDPSIIGAQVDGVILVANPTRLRRQDAMRCVDVLHSLGAAILGVVINGLPESKSGYGYYGYGYYGYGYGYGQRNPYIQPDDENANPNPNPNADGDPADNRNGQGNPNGNGNGHEIAPYGHAHPNGHGHGHGPNGHGNGHGHSHSYSTGPID